jgi:1-deoxy-D-xylulose-5-phosphate reductoisomerase
MKKRISILGSTGSIGTQTLDVVSHYPETIVISALAGGSNIGLLAEQTKRFRPQLVSVATKELAEELRVMLSGSGTATPRIVFGPEGLAEAASGTDADVVVTAVVGSQGLQPTLAALEAGKHIALANKETLVSAGHLVTELAARKGLALLPVDSEHSAIFQCLNGERNNRIRRITLTASGGSFRDKSREELAGVTVEQALKHPNWSMGAKITIDSATMANKGLEVMEARWLFGLTYDQIDVIIHPESIVHSYVEFVDSSIIAQMGLPDMRVPIQYALTYPDRLPTPVPPLNLAEMGKLHFRAMDFERFRLLRLAFEAGRAGGTAPTVFNAANEVAVARFLRGEIGFLQIEDVVERALQQHAIVADPGLEAILEADAWARNDASRPI